jgi:hypothetical protein
MLAEFTVDLGPQSPALELPWAAADAQFVDLRAEPERVAELPEMLVFPSLREFLLAVNARQSPLASAKCDAWSTAELAEEELSFGAPLKFVCYVDLVFVDAVQRASLEQHQAFAQRVCELLARAPELPCALELVLRRCYFHQLQDEAASARTGADAPPAGKSDDGFCLTLYCTGYGEEEDQARQRCAIALQLVQNAIAQVWARKPAS